MADGNLEKIKAVLENINIEIAVNEVLLDNKVEKTTHTTDLAKLKEELKEDYNAKIMRLLWKVALLSGAAGGGAGWMAILMMKGK